MLITTTPGDTAPTIKPRVLVVDRNADLCEIFSFFLQLSDCEVKTAHSGAVGLNCAKDFAPDLVFSSLRIGEIDGFALAKALRKLPQTSKSVLVAMSAYGNEITGAYEAGFDHYLTKPVSLDALTAVLAPIKARTRCQSNIHDFKPVH